VKTYVFDSGALLALFENCPGTHKINELLKEAHRGHSRILMSCVNFGEVYGKIVRDHGSNQALWTLSAARSLPIDLYEVDEQRAVDAQNVKTKYNLYYVHSFAAALAIEHKATLVTNDSDLRKLGRTVPVLWLKTT
jgi:predicted nucleic acid-binding protein